MDSLSPDIQQFLRMLIALGLVLALMFGLSLLLKKLGLVKEPVLKKGEKPRLKIIESLTLDARRRVVILGCDQKQYLVVLGPNGEMMMDSNISPVDSSDKETTPSS